MDKFFADTYALIEILKGNPNYSKYAGLELYSTEFNLLELSYALTRDFGPERAKGVLTLVRATLIILSPTTEHYIKASDMRLKEKRNGKKLSLIDCLGYVIANDLGLRFLTGDREFEGMENVEFVK